MRILPCSTCRAPALATREGVYQTAARLSTPVMTYKCKRCGRVQTITSAEFARLPLMTDAEIAARTCDLSLPAEPAEPTPTDTSVKP